MNKPKRIIKTALIIGLTSFLFSCTSPGPERVTLDPDSRQFLDMISYIVLPVEEKIFREMPPEDRGEFIRDFWGRRDPDPSNPDNEYRATYYERLRTADKAFGKGGPGWKTDRGRIYILLGPPTNVITKTMGGSPNPNNFFGRENPIESGTLTERPTEIWVYDNYSEYFAGPLRMVFIDYHSTGSFKLTANKEITAFSMVSPTWDPPDLAKYQRTGEIEMEEQNPGNSIIFDYNAEVAIERDGMDSLALVTLDIPLKRVEARKQGQVYSLDLTLSVDIVDQSRNLLTRMEEPHIQTLSFFQLKSMLYMDQFIHKEWRLALPSNSRFVYISVTDNNKEKRLRKLLQINR